MSFPAYSGRLAILVAATAAAPDDIPTWGISLGLEDVHESDVYLETLEMIKSKAV